MEVNSEMPNFICGACVFYLYKRKIMKINKFLMTAAVAAALSCPHSEACSRVVYLGDSGTVLVGRTLDWRTPIPTNIYVYPAGVAKESNNSGERLRWTSRYGSVLAVGYDGGVTEGMNSEGLVLNGLFCKTSQYPVAAPGSNTPMMSLAVLVSYFLDNFATVDEVDTWLQANKFAIAGATFDGGTVSMLHWGFTDRTGETLIMEFIGGEMHTYRGRELQVLTNDPAYPQMQAIDSYWQGVGGANMLPGTVRSADRFVRASFFIRQVPTNFDYDHAWAALNSIMGTVSVPYGYEIEGEPNVSSTQWTSIADSSGGKYYMRFADNKGYFWVDLGRLILTPGAPVLKLDTTDHSRLDGCINNLLVHSEPFTPMW